MMNNLYQTDLHRIIMSGPGDMSELRKLLDQGVLAARDIVAIFAKTEGNGCVNDFTREYASQSFAHTLAEYRKTSVAEVDSEVALVMSGGTEGVLCPHATLFTRKRVEGVLVGEKRLSIGVAHTRAFLPEELGREAQIQETAIAVRKAMAQAQIEHDEDVHFVQIKCPLLTSYRMTDAVERGFTTVTDDTYASMAYSRGASALAVAVALGEIDLGAAQSALLKDWGVYSNVASVSAGVELNHSAVVVLGNSKKSFSHHKIGHAVMSDALDLNSVFQAYSSAGIGQTPNSWVSPNGHRTHVFAKAESSPNGLIRGFRHTMLDDSDINATRHARAAVGGLIAGVAGCGAIYVSGGAEHQGPPGGGPVAVISELSDD